jgi:hypothetical protein
MGRAFGCSAGNAFRYALTPASFSLRSVDQTLDTGHKSGRLNVKGCRDIEHCAERRAFLTALQQANVCAVVAALVC